MAITIAALLAAPAFAQPQTHPIDLAVQDLASALSELARLENLELLFDRTLVAGISGHEVHGATSARDALDQLLRGTGLSYRQTVVGTVIIFREQVGANTARTPVQALAIEEILVIGRRTQNTDIRRSPDDIQPYQVASAAVIADSQSMTAEEFLRNHLSSDTLAFALDQDPQNNRGSTRSSIDLRGLGPDQTLVLVDGRRLPSIPIDVGLTQPDLNGLSLGMIDRIETLGASTGGIFGINAAGGVVNVVLKRQFEGVAFNAVNGISARGDAWHWGAEGRFGFTNESTGTRIMLSVGHFQDDGLKFGDRDFVVKARQLQIERSPNERVTVASQSINFKSFDGTNLTLKAMYGGGALGASTTFMPFDAPPVADGGAAILLANAGGYDISLSPDGQGALQSLITPRRATSVLATLRQEIGPNVETYLDLLWLQNGGHATYPALSTATNQFSSASPGNPFNEGVFVSFPTPNLVGSARSLTLTDRLSIGANVRLGGSWSANIDATIGEARVTTAADIVLDDPRTINTLLGETALVSQLDSLEVTPALSEKNRNRLYDFNLRLGGALFELDGGPLTLTATAEFLREAQRLSSHSFFSGSDTVTAAARQVISAFLELRAPLVSAENDTVLRGLELQIALRGDRYSQSAPGLLLGFDIRPDPPTAHGEMLAATFGAKVSPIQAVMLRASVATGYTPPTSTQLAAFEIQSAFIIPIVDPRRGGLQPISPSDPLTLLLGGSVALRPQKTTTFSAGAVWRPDFVADLRLSLDYSRLRTSREITNFAQGNFQYFVDNEALYPGRITRAPLSASDAALGYTAGKIIVIDAGSLQVGRSVLEVVDFNLDYVRATDFGAFHAYAQVSWELSFRRHGDPRLPSYDLTDHVDGPLSWRGNGGIAWSRGDWSSGLNLQFYGPYSGYFGAPITPILAQFLVGSDTVDTTGTNASYIPPQVYVDWLVGWRTTLALPQNESTALEFRFGVRNIFDSLPSVAAGTFDIKSKNTGFKGYDFDPTGGYGAYGDPRGRRFELTVSAAL